MFIQIEGIDGAGKTTQCNLLRDAMLASNIRAVIVKELDSTNFGKKVREILVREELNASVAEMFLFLASKAQVFSENILPALARGECVIADRGNGSFISYNASLGIDKELLMTFLNVANFGTVPDLTILIDLPVELAKKRIELKAEKSRFDLVDNSQMEYQRQQFLILAKSLPRWMVIDGSLEKEVIYQQIAEKVLGRF